MKIPRILKKRRHSRPYVVYWNNIPSPYMVERFNALVNRADFEFEAWFNDRLEADRSWVVNEKDWRFQYRYVDKVHLLGKNFHFPLLLIKKRPSILVTLHAQPSFIFGWMIAIIRGVKTAFWVEVTYDKWIKRNRIKEWIKRQLLPRADAIITVGNDGKQFAEKYGVQPDKIFFAPHTIDVPHYANLSLAARKHRNSFRKTLKLEGFTYIYVGRLWWGKGINYLLDAFKKVQQQSTEPISLLLLGDGEEKQNLRQICEHKKIQNVVFAGFIQKPELPQYYAAADVFVFPTLGDPYGLVVDEAMACSLPIISTSSAGEIRDRVKEGINGYIVPPQDSNALAVKMLYLANSHGLCKRMGNMSARIIHGHTPDKWAEDFKEIVNNMSYGINS